MKVNLAGYNLDSEVISQLENQEHHGENNLTPEVISAAYARISRDPRDVDELRQISRGAVDKARSSNKTIVFGLGHHSVAEHANFNYDILGISRLAIEALEHHRLCSFTEKSQRYITLDGDFVMPEELSKNEQVQLTDLIKLQNNFYQETFPKLFEYQKQQNPDLTKKKRSLNTLEGWAKEDARYALSLATEAQLGFTANARNLEYVVLSLKNHDLAEVRELGEKLYQETKEIAPSLLILADEKEFEKAQGTTLDDKFMKEGKGDIRSATNELFSFSEPRHIQRGVDLKTTLQAGDIDKNIISALIANNSNFSYDLAEQVYHNFKLTDKQDYLKSCLVSLGKYDAVPREFEYGDLKFNTIMSASCFAQIKRHRMATILSKFYNPNFDVVVPDSITQIGQEENFRKVTTESALLYNQLKNNHPENPRVAEYALTNAHQREVMIKMNMRSFYHFSRLREDAHAQWDIRNLAHEMINLVREFAPATSILLGGKSEYDEIKKRVYGK